MAKKTNGRAICQEAVAWRAGAPEMAFGALGGGDWWDKHRLGYGVVATVASLQHWASRLKMVASVAKCLLGERSLQFFRFRGPRCVGQRDLYPFAIFLRELPVDRHEELIRRAMRWPDPLADQIARVLKR